jgi:hypothetical protein
MADMLVADVERELRRLQTQSTPVHGSASAAGFRH